MGLVRNGSKATSFVKIDKIINLMVNELNNDEELKRYLLFLTKQPLENYSVDNNGTKIYQYDIPKDLTKENKYCISKPNSSNPQYRTSPRLIVPYLYEENKITSENPMMFIHNSSYSCNDLVSSNIYGIDILVPSDYIKIQSDGENYYENRLHKIMERIADIFDDTYTDKETSKEIGDLKFELIGVVYEERVGKSNDITISTINIRTTVINTRMNNGGKF